MSPGGVDNQRTSAHLSRVYPRVAALLGAILAVAVLWGCGGPPEKDSLVLIIAQGVRADHLGPYGYSKQTSPALDALASGSVVFERAYSSTPQPVAAAASLLTGRYPEEHGLLYGRKLDGSLVTLQSHLAERGYQTHLISSDPILAGVEGLTDGYEGVEIVDPAETALLDGGSAEVTQKAAEWIRRARNPRQPFFLTLVYSGATLPFDPPEPHDGMFTEPWMQEEILERASGFWLPMARRINSGELEVGDADRQVFSALYDGELSYLDAKIGEVIRVLGDEGLMSHAFVVVTSDRGNDLGESGSISNDSSLTEASLHVPMILRRPGDEEGGSRAAGLFQDVDLVPTLCDLLGVPAPETVGGASISQAPLDGASRRANAVSVAVRPAGPRVLSLAMSLREERYRYLLAPEGAVSLLDLRRTDSPREILPSSPEIARQLHTRLGAWHAMLEPPPGGRLQPAVPPRAEAP